MRVHGSVAHDVDTPDKLLRELQRILSFDRPRSRDWAVRQARDAMLIGGYPVVNESRKADWLRDIKSKTGDYW